MIGDHLPGARKRPSFTGETAVSAAIEARRGPREARWPDQPPRVEEINAALTQGPAFAAAKWPFEGETRRQTNSQNPATSLNAPYIRNLPDQYDAREHEQAANSLAEPGVAHSAEQMQAKKCAGKQCWKGDRQILQCREVFGRRLQE